jgi:hypothetical protein
VVARSLLETSNRTHVRPAKKLTRVITRFLQVCRQWLRKSPQADLAVAEKLINDCGHHRPDEELADAKRAILG